MLASIIVPVYNSEKYIEECLESIVDCNLRDCEIIIVLGDSEDGSKQICEMLSKKYDFVYLIEQIGQGLSNARNCAMEVARGKYIVFIDSDDTVNPVYFQAMLQRLRVDTYEPDVIVTDYRYYDYRFHAWRNVYQIGENTPDQYSMDFLPTMLRMRSGFWNVWRYVYRRAFLEEHNLTFWENMSAEDMDFTARVFLLNPKIVFTHCPYYVYTIGRGSSLMDKPTLKRFRETEEVIRTNCERLKNSDFAYASLIRDRYQYEYILAMAQIVQFAPSVRREFIQIFAKWKSVLAGSTDPVVKGACFALRAMGIYGMGYLLHILKLIHHQKLERSFRK